MAGSAVMDVAFAIAKDPDPQQHAEAIPTIAVISSTTLPQAWNRGFYNLAGSERRKGGLGAVAGQGQAILLGSTLAVIDEVLARPWTWGRLMVASLAS